MNAIIYTPAGRAKEYCSLAVNLYRGCNHQCVYCYAPAAIRVKPQDFVIPTARRNILEKLHEDAATKPGNGAHVLLSFTSDPYNSADRELRLTREAIKILKAAGYSIVLLTKAGMQAARDYDLLDECDYVGASLTLTDPAQSKSWESEAALPEDRIQMLREAKARRLNTWVSLEPVIDPEQSIEIIRRTESFVDLYKIGKLHYHQTPAPVDWARFARDVIALMEHYQKTFYLKESLRQYLG